MIYLIHKIKETNHGNRKKEVVFFCFQKFEQGAFKYFSTPHGKYPYAKKKHEQNHREPKRGSTSYDETFG